MTSRGPKRRRPLTGGASALAEAWAWELAAAGLIRLTRAEIELHLRGQVDRLLTALHADPFRPADGQQVGSYLVELGADSADALRRTFLLLSGRLLIGSRLSGEAGRDRVTRLLVELVAGWTDARQAATLTEQERLGRAVRTVRRGGPGYSPFSPWFDC